MLSNKEYKITEVGQIPSDWNVVKTQDISDLKTGGTPSKAKPEYWNGDIKWMASGDIHLKRIYDVQGRISRLGFDNSNTKTLPKKTVMIALNGQGKTRGTVAILETELTCNQSLAGFTPSDKFIPEFLLYNLQNRYSEIRNLTGDGARNGLNLAILREIKVALPSLYEQKKIALILSSVDNSIEKIEAIIEQTEKLKKGLMQQLFTKGIGCTKFKKAGVGNVPFDWKVVQLKDLVEENRTICYGVLKPGEFVENGIPMLRVVDLENGKVKESGFHKISKNLDEEYIRSRLMGNEVLISLVGTIGRIAVTESYHRFMNVHRNIGIIPVDKKKIDKRYLAYIMQSEMVQKEIRVKTTGGNQPLFNLGDLRNLNILLPPLKEQLEIVNIISCIDKKLEVETEKQSQLKQLKLSLMQSLLTGKVRVKNDKAEVMQV